MNDATAERWKPIPGSPGYEVSDRGRVRSLDRLVYNRMGHYQRRRGRVLKPGTSTRGHLVVSVGSPIKTVLLHPLVLEAFVGPRPPGMVACHWDDDVTNNRLDNLRWATPSDNMYDRIRNGKHRQANQTHCIRMHILDGPNLVPSNTTRGTRGCLACNRAGGLRRKRLKLGQPVADLDTLADAYYADIMSGRAAPPKPRRKSRRASSPRQVGTPAGGCSLPSVGVDGADPHVDSRKAS
jgi:hypothetical protein